LTALVTWPVNAQTGPLGPTTLQRERELTINDVDLSCYYPQGTIVKREVNCNRQFMLQIMPKIAQEI